MYRRFRVCCIIAVFLLLISFCSPVYALQTNFRKNLSRLRDNPPNILFAADEFEASYDLRNEGRVSPIRDQEQWGTCWAFAAMSAIESNYLTQFQKVSETNPNPIDLSELHMAWFCRNNIDKTKTFTSQYSRSEVTYKSIEGGVPDMSIAYLTRLDGLVSEDVLPYLSYKAISNDAGYSPEVWTNLSESFDALPSYRELNYLSYLRSGRYLLPLEDTSPNEYEPVVKLRLKEAPSATHFPIIGEKMRTESDDIDDPKNIYIDPVYTKALIKQYGALEIAYHSNGGNPEFFNTSNNAFYYSGKDCESANHAVVIIGWDDNFSRDKFNENDRPKNNGAWLVRNNWGGEWADGGYFWMSYEQYIDAGVAYVMEELPENLKVYAHDPLGCCDFAGVSGSRTMWGANAFQVKSDGEKLESFGFHTTDNNATVEWEIFEMTSKPTDSPRIDGATKIASGSQNFPYAGYHSIKINPNVALTRGNYFSIVIKFTNGYSNYPLAVETKVENYSDFATVHDYESWFSADGIDWTDGTEAVGEDNGKIIQIPFNVCIKAFVIYDPTVEGELADEEPNTILGLKVNDYLNAVDANVVNVSIPDEPLDKRALFILADMERSEYPDGTEVKFYLVNRTEEREFVSNYVASKDTMFPTGLIKASFDYAPLFEEGYEPDEFWRAENCLEFPVYGPFIEETEEGMIGLDVDDLTYSDGEKKGRIPKGYYDLVYKVDVLGDFTGSINLRLNATKIDDASSEEATNNSNIGHSSSGCDIGISMFGILLAGSLIFMKHCKL